VDNVLAVPQQPVIPPRPQRPSAGTILTLVNGVLAGVGGVYVGTNSVLVTVIAAVMASVIAALMLVLHRQP
jgi:phage shock protein PspC (stress-responsive transcriptional regulator)